MLFRVIAIYILVAVWCNKLAAIDSLTLVNTYQTPVNNISQIQVDFKSNIYAVSESILYRWTADSNNITNYSSDFFGDISKIDVGGGLNILCFYQESQQIVILDNFLVEKSIIDLKDLGIEQASTVCWGNDQEILVFDEQDFKLWSISAYRNRIKTLVADHSLNNTLTILDCAFVRNMIVSLNEDQEMYIHDFMGQSGTSSTADVQAIIGSFGQSILVSSQQKWLLCSPNNRKQQPLNLPIKYTNYTAAFSNANGLYLLIENELFWFK